jgi:hypothetical protein
LCIVVCFNISLIHTSLHNNINNKQTNKQTNQTQPGDGLLGDDDISYFNRKTFETDLPSKDLDNVKRIAAYSNAGFVDSDKNNAVRFEVGLLFLHCCFVVLLFWIVVIRVNW